MATMTPQVFRAALRELGMTQLRAAEFLRVLPTTVNRWARGTRKIPGPVMTALECLRERRALENHAQKLQMTSTSTVSSTASPPTETYRRRDNRLPKS